MADPRRVQDSEYNKLFLSASEAPPDFKTDKYLWCQVVDLKKAIYAWAHYGERRGLWAGPRQCLYLDLENDPTARGTTAMDYP